MSTSRLVRRVDGRAEVKREGRKQRLRTFPDSSARISAVGACVLLNVERSAACRKIRISKTVLRELSPAIIHASSLDIQSHKSDKVSASL